MSKKDAAKLLGLTLDEYDSVLYQTAHQWGITKERERIARLLTLLATTAPSKEWKLGLEDALYIIQNPDEIRKVKFTKNGSVMTDHEVQSILKGEKE